MAKVVSWSPAEEIKRSIPRFNIAVNDIFSKNCHAPWGEERERPGKHIHSKGNRVCKGTEAVKAL